MRKKRHNYTPEEKVSILRRHLVEHTAVPTGADAIVAGFYRGELTSKR